MDILTELNAFACGLDSIQKQNEIEQTKIWELILNGGKEK